jgi:hypothetical protein
MPDLNLDLNYFDHPKTRRLTGLLGRGSEVLPIKLWAYTGRLHAETGELAGYTPEEVEACVGWWGKSGEMVSAMLREPCQFLQALPDGNGYEVVGFLEHQGHISAFKTRAKAAAESRWGVAGKRHATSNAKRTRKQCPNQPNQLNQPTNLYGCDDPPGFVEFWKLYPPQRKDDRKGCLRIWTRDILEPQAQTILFGLERWKHSIDWGKNAGQYIPGPAPFLNKRKWEARPPQASGGDETPDDDYEATPEQIAIFEGEA